MNLHVSAETAQQRVVLQKPMIDDRGGQGPRRTAGTVRVPTQMASINRAFHDEYVKDVAPPTWKEHLKTLGLVSSVSAGARQCEWARSLEGRERYDARAIRWGAQGAQ